MNKVSQLSPLFLYLIESYLFNDLINLEVIINNSIIKKWEKEKLKDGLYEENEPDHVFFNYIRTV